MKKSYIAVSCSVLMFLVACSSGGGKSWSTQMKAASRILSDLMPKVVLDKWENNDKEKADLKALTLQLSGVSHGIDSTMSVPSLDPSLKFVSREFKKELTKAQWSMDQGKWAVAQQQVKRATQYCIACHSMTTSSSSTYSFNLSADLKRLTDYEKAVYFTAIRQFEKALIHYEAALNDKDWAKKNPKLWNEGILGIMSIAGRIKRDPLLILEMASRFFDTGAYPTELKRAALRWREDAKAWRKSKTARINLDTTYSYMKRASSLERKRKHSGLVLYLRASSNLNELLRMGAIGEYNTQRAYYMAGQLAEALGDSSFTGFAEDYYKICLEKSEKTSSAKLCKKALDKFNKKRRL